MPLSYITLDGNEAASQIGYRTNEVIAIYPITPASQMGEQADAWAAAGKTNVWGSIPIVRELQSEGGASGAIHGSVQAGALSTTFTSSQGLLLMIPNMLKMAGELSSAVIHVASRTVGQHALSIYVEHNDVMSTRSTGWGILFSNNVQEVLDFAAIAQAATLEARVPFVHAFDGFRTSHEVSKVAEIDDETLLALIKPEWIAAYRARALTPDKPVLRGTVQNTDVYFQARERSNPYYFAAPGIVQGTMDRFAELTGRRYRVYEYFGEPDAERVIVLMGSSCETVQETVEHLAERGEKVGVVKVRMFRPFDAGMFVRAFPKTVRAVAVLDRTKEFGSAGEPLYLDAMTTIAESMQWDEPHLPAMPKVVAGRYGIGGKEFTPAMVKAVLDNLAEPSPRGHFTVGIDDDVTHLSLDYDESFRIEKPDVVRALFWGLGADGTVSANKNTIKIIGEETDDYVQAYFLYDSKKSGSITESHLRFGPRPIRSSYLISDAGFVGVHSFDILARRPVVERAAHGATLLLNSPYGREGTWDRIPRPVQEQILAKNLKVFGIDAYGLARELGLGNRISAIMQTAFFLLADLLPKAEALAKIKHFVQKSYGNRGPAVVTMNIAAIDRTESGLYEVPLGKADSKYDLIPPVVPYAPDAIKEFYGPVINGHGDSLKVSQLSVDGTFVVGTTKWEKRNISLEAPVWDPDLCIQCGRCVLVCPHGVIRAKIAPASALEGAPEGFLTAKPRWREYEDSRYTIQVSALDCTGCALCSEVCPAKDKTAVGHKALDMRRRTDPVELESARWDFFCGLPQHDRYTDPVRFTSIRNLQLLDPLFEFSGACTGCGETPYVKLVSQLFGDRALMANAAGCSSVFGGALPTTPYTTDHHGRGPAWSNSLFEDNAEYGYGYRLAIDAQINHAREMLDRIRGEVPEELAARLVDPALSIYEKREAVAQLRTMLASKGGNAAAEELGRVAEAFVPKSVWIMGGDGWAYDIGYGGVDHVIASSENVNFLVLDTEVYSNTGGQMSKATSRGAVVKFAAGGKPARKKDLGRMAISYGSAYVAQVAMGADDAQCVKAFIEAESYDGPSLLICYSPCIAHGIDMRKGLEQQKLAVDSGHWPLYRYDPRLEEKGKNPFQLDSKEPTVPLEEYLYRENRYRQLLQTHPDEAARLLDLAKRDVQARWHAIRQMMEQPANGA